ncbi:uncharacterized protein LOC111044474 isoform X1 [Nilaparvata lugens]|uniref:uncharacterized protein LOC111044474 isoform X1 n=1 Tax=Nilaparvata lugens TaxID=108931 RepID=UPI00193DFC2E|nr:uncharacterized protein LOC111044474 isoform X1 [Nilaparvata lugens]
MNRHQCNFCPSSYRNLRDLKTHEKNKHGVSKKFKCSQCNAQSNYIRNMHRHERLKHNIVHDKSSVVKSKGNVKFTLVKCHLCTTCIRVTKLVDHYKSEHSLDVEIDEREFTNYEEFKSWKFDEEEGTQSKFIKSTSTVSYKRCSGESVSYEYFSCQHSGTYVPKGKGVRKRGTKKIGMICPAEMKLTIGSDGVCQVRYVKTHVGHTSTNPQNLEIPADIINNCTPVEETQEFPEFELQASHTLDLRDSSVIVIVEPYQENAIILNNSSISLQQKRDELVSQFQVMLDSVKSIEELMFIEGECLRIQSQLSVTAFD